MKHPVHPCDEIRGVGDNHIRVALESLENLPDIKNMHPVNNMEPTPEPIRDAVRFCIACMLDEVMRVSVNQREAVLMRLAGYEWAAIAGHLGLRSVQAAEYHLRAALRANPRLKSLFPKTNGNQRRTS